MGHQVTVLNRRWPESNGRLIIKMLSIFTKSILRKLLIGKKSIIVRNHRFSKAEEDGRCEIKRFIKKHIHLTKPLRSSAEMQKYVESKEFDCIVVGSDQVWREVYCPCIEDFFLVFLKEDDNMIKVAYAASFGTTEFSISGDHLKRCITLARRFHSISVRECSGVEIMDKVFRLNVKRFLDPTLLLDYDRYRFFVRRTKITGVLSYILDETDEKMAILNDVSDMTGLKIKRIKFTSACEDDSVLVLPSVEEWLSSFTTADFVVTDSFHGCVFSIINHKPFIAIANKDRGLERFTTLLETFGLMDRLVFDFDGYCSKKNLLFNTIDFNKVEAIRQCLIQESMNFLTSLAGLNNSTIHRSRYA